MVISHPAGSGAIVSDPSAATPTFTPDFPGDYQLRVVATDSTSRKSPAAFVNITANACAPIVAAFSTQSAIIGRAVTLTAPPVTDTCVPSPSFTYQWTLITRPSRSEALLVAANTSAASFTPDVAGDYQAQLVVTDQAGFVSAPQTVVVHAAPCGAAAPALSNLAASPAMPNIGDTTAFSVQVTDPNATTCSSAVPVTPFRYSWSLVSKPRGSAASMALQTSATPLLVPDVPGAYEVSVIVMDALGNSSDPAFLTISTTSCGFFAPITAIAQPSPIATNSNTPVALSAVATSSDNDSATCPARFRDTFTFTWSIVSAPGASRLSATSGASTSFTASSAGTYTVQAVATASNGTSSAPAFVTINVAACGSASPVIVATANAPAFPAPTQDVSLTAQASDPDTACGFPAPGFTWSIHSLPQGSATVLQNPGGAAHFVPDVQGTYVFRVVATDSTGLSSAPSFVSIDVFSPDPDKSTITVLGGSSVATVVADDVNAGTITVTLRNRAGSPMAQLPVRITASGTGNTFNPGGAFASGSTDVNGVFTATMVSTTAELKTFSAIAGPAFAPVTLNTHPQLEYVAGPAARIVVTIGANPAATGMASSFTAIARDHTIRTIVLQV
jgi:hypothetical protein